MCLIAEICLILFQDASLACMYLYIFCLFLKTTVTTTVTVEAKNPVKIDFTGDYAVDFFLSFIF